MSDIRPIGNDTPVDVLLNKTFTGPTRSGYVEVGKDNTCLVEYFKDYAERIQNFEVRDEDVYLLGFPKSGTTLLTEMIWLLMNNLNYKEAREELIVFRVLMLEYPSVINPKFLREVYNYYNFDTFQNLPNPRCFKSHLSWSLLPQQIQDDTKKPKIIVIVRKAEDVCISHYHFSKHFEGYTGTWEEFCELFLAGRICFGPYWKQSLSLWEHRERPNILFLKFKEAVLNLPECVEKVANFLDKDLTTEEILKLADHLSFNSMKNNSSVSYEDFKTKSSDEAVFYRSGEVDQFKTAMSSEMRKRFEEWSLENIGETGLE